jgi:hypothetical protein
MNTVDGSPFSKNVFFNNVSKKLLALFGSFTAVVGRYGLAVDAFAFVPNILDIKVIEINDYLSSDVSY